jgi:uncharacterized protein YhjY with autotransporter beta-barrel domain
MYWNKFSGVWRRLLRPATACLPAIFCLLWLLAPPAYAQGLCASPQQMSVPFNDSATLDLYSCTPEGYGGVTVSPSHGTLPGMSVAIGQSSSVIRYQHSGDSATSDTFTVKDAYNFAIVVNVTIAAQTTPLTIGPASLANPVLGSSYSQAITTSGGVGGYTYALASGSLPAGLSVGANGVISGVPTGTGNFTFSVRSTDSSSPTPYSATKSYSFSVAIPTVTVTTASLPNGMVSIGYSQQLSASGGTSPYTYARNSGSFPPGLTLSTGGLLSGTPTTAGSYTFSVAATDNTSGAGPYTGAKNFTVVIDPLPAPPVAGNTTAAIAFGAGATPISLVLSGGTATSVAVAGTPAHGTALASGTGITYAPAPGYAGSDSFTYTASNLGGTSSAATVSISVAAPTLSISPASGSLSAAVPSAYSQTFAASGGYGGYTYAQSGALPAGLSFDASSGVLSGVPRQPGSFPITVSATDHSTGLGPFTVTGNYMLTVANATVTLSPNVLTQPQVGQAYNLQLVAAGGVSPYTYTLTSGPLPAGLQLSSTGLLYGTPTASGSYNVIISAVDSSVGQASQAYKGYTGTVGAGAPVAAASTASVAYGSAANAITLSLSGGTAASVAVVTGAAHGTASASGTSISYTPTTGYAGTDSFTYNATNAAGTSATVTVSITVAAPTLSLTPTFLTTQPQRGVAYSQQLSAAGGMAPYTYAVTSGSAPAGTTLSTDGLLAGVPTTAGAYNFTVTATDSSTNSHFTAVRTYSGTVGAGAPIAAASTATVAYGSLANTVTLTLSGGTPTSVAVVTGATHGTASASGTSISYTPATGYAGADAFTYNATNAAGTSATVTVSVTVTAPTLTLTPTSLLQPQLNVAYSQQLTAAGGMAPYTFAVTSGSTPAGITLSSTGLLAGAATAAGAYNFTVTATDSSTATHFTVVQAYSGTVGAGAPVAAASSAPVAYGSPGTSISLALSGGMPTLLTLVSGATHGLATVSGISISYTPTTGYAGTDSFSYNATNAVGTSATVTVTITVAAPTLTLTPATLAQPELGVAYSQQLTAAGGMAPYTYAVTSGATPAGTTLSAAGLLAGTPTAAGAYSFTVTATDSSTATHFTVQQPYSGTVGAGAPVAAASAATVNYGSSGNNISLSLSGGSASSLAVVSSGAHGTAAVNGTSISYTPAAGYAGPDAFTYNASNGVGTSATVTVSITIAPPTLAMAPAGAALSTGTGTGSAYSQVFQASGGTGPYIYLQTGTLPAGLSFNAATATLSGAATQAGTFSFSVRATDGSSGTGAPFAVLRSYTLTVTQPTPPATPALTLSPAAIAQPQQGIAYSQQLSATGGTAPYAYALTSGTLPAGVSLSAAGLLSGMPSVTGAYSFTISVTDSAAVPARAAQVYSGSVSLGKPVAAASRADVAYGSQASAIALSLSGGTAASVTLVAGATHGNAVASGTAVRYTPNAGYSGPDAFSYLASNASGNSATVVVSLTVTAPTLALGASAPWTATVGQAYSQTITWSGGAAPYKVAAVTGLPAGLTVSTTSANGLTISGTPTQTGSFAVLASATDSSSGSGAPFSKGQEFTLVVGAPAPSASPHSATASTGSSAEVDLMAGALNGPFTAAAVASISPPEAGTAVIVDTGTAGSPAYHLRYAAARGFSGVAKIGYTLSNAAGTSPVALVDITVAARTDVANDAQVKALASAQTDAANRFVIAQLGNFGRRLERLHGDGWARSSFGLTLVPVQPSLRQQASQWQEGDIIRSAESPLQARLRKVGWGQQETATDTSRIRKAAMAQDKDKGALPELPGQAEAREALSLWVDGAIDFGQRNARGEQQGFRFTSNGISTGGDYRFSSSLTLGIGAGFSRANTDIGDNGSKSKASSAIMSVYGSVRPSRDTFIDGVLGYGTLDLDAVRYVTGDGSYATSTRGGKQQFVALSGGYEYRREGWMLSPYGRLELASTTLDRTSETASGNNALTYFKQTSRVSSGVLGLRGEGQISGRAGIWSPRMRVEYRRQFSGAGAAGIAYKDLAADGPAYMLQSDAQVVATWTAGLGVRLLLNNGTSLLLDYSSNLNSGQGRYQSVLFGIAAPF